MSDFPTVPGFEDVWRAPVRPLRRSPKAILGRPASSGSGIRARLIRIVNRVPEVMVKVTGRTRDPGHLRAHLDYISRNGHIEVEGAEGWLLQGRAAVREVADDWSAIGMADRRRREGSPLSHSIVLSMPEATDPMVVRDAARAFASDAFGERFDYVFALHTDTPRPHVHVAVCSLGRQGERLNPKKADLEHWRQTFAQALRDRGVDAEATPRRARGETRKAERAPLRRMRERHERGEGARSQRLQAAYREAAKVAFGGPSIRPPWEQRLLDRQASIRGVYLEQAGMLKRSTDEADRALGTRVEAFVRAMSQPDSQRLALARALRSAHQIVSRRSPPVDKDRSR